MKPKEYKILELAIEEGVNYGYNRAYKYNDNPLEFEIKNEIHDAVLTSICEWFDFENI